MRKKVRGVWVKMALVVFFAFSGFYSRNGFIWGAAKHPPSKMPIVSGDVRIGK